MALPTIRATGSVGVGTGGPTVPLTAPTCSVGDLLIAITDPVDFNPPTGWSTVTEGSGAGSPAPSLYAKVAAVGDSGSTFNFTAAPAGSDMTGWRGVIIAIANAVSWEGVQSINGDGTFATEKSITPAAMGRANELIMEIWSFGPGNTGIGATITSAPGTSLVSTAATGTQHGMQVSVQSYTLPTSPATETLTVSHREPAWSTVSLAFYGNEPPTTPTGLSPDGGVVLDSSDLGTFSWSSSDPDAPLDSIAGFDIQASSDGGTTWTTLASRRTGWPFNAYGIGAVANGNYEWQVRTYDTFGAVSAWSASAHFTAATPPAGPTITTPTAGGTVANSPSTVSWTDSSQTAYQVRRVADNAGSPDPTTVYYDSGQIVGSSTSLDIPFETNSRTEHVQVRIESGGLWSAWSDHLVHVSYEPPPAAAVTLTPIIIDGVVYPLPTAFDISWATPAPGTGQVPAIYVDVLRSEDSGATLQRVATQQPTSGTWRDETPASGVEYSYEVVTFAANGASTPSTLVGLAGTPEDGGEDLIDPGGP